MGVQANLGEKALLLEAQLTKSGFNIVGGGYRFTLANAQPNF